MPLFIQKSNFVLVKQENQLVKRRPKVLFHQLPEVVIFFMLLTLHDSLVALTSLEPNAMWVQWLKNKTQYSMLFVILTVGFKCY